MPFVSNDHDHPTGRRRAGLGRVCAAGAVGLVATGLALAAGEVTAALTGPGTSPVVAVGSAAIDLAPTWLKEYAVRSFGTHDKAVLLTGIYAVTALFAALVGLIALRRPAVGAAVTALFGALGVWAAASRPTARAADALPSVAAGLADAAALWFLSRSLRRATGRAPDTPTDRTGPPDAAAAGPPRRTVVVATGAGAAVAVLGTAGGRRLADSRNDVGAARAAVRLPAPAVPARPRPAGVHPAVPGLTPFVTPTGDFYRVDTALTLPAIDPRDWSLRIHGLVDHPVVLSFEDLLRQPLEELDLTLSCVSNEVGGRYAGTARWLGAPLPALLRRAGVRPGADQLVGRSRDGMTIGTPLESVLDGRRALLAVAMNGEPLPVAHGFPCRSLVPGLYGYTSATKWLVELEVTRFAAFDPYWVRRGWDRTGEVRTASRIEVPAPFARVPAGDVDLAGTAWATHRGVAAVEVRVDGGAWQQAALAADGGPDLWRQWSHTWRGAAPGTHRIEVRATDAGGRTQPETRRPPFPSGSTGWHSTVVTVF
ncbi:molybdopterin-dependent oxidoreductase [Streptomyces sp. NRRL B-24484]|uniref:molybdopterin-dependent oxidoreductase n=1 Tax=Streptomyces sp. NRRL B-24484 TaxID=1463833 RepID=UPI0004C1C0E0|nr:molybdopterin-dependent oxidoreductase [Streptomyces sp. NRRL B-24484]